jgi:hypothetical protein
LKGAEGSTPAKDKLATTKKDTVVEEGNHVGTLPKKKRTKKKKVVQQAIADKPAVADPEPTVSAANNEEGGEPEVSKKAGMKRKAMIPAEGIRTSNRHKA